MTDPWLAPELAPYQGEPAQLPSGSVGKWGLAHLEFARREGRTVLAASARRAPLVVHQALYWDDALPTMACVFLISVSGGLVQGDRQEIEIEAGAEALAHVTTQAATKIQAMDANYAAQRQRLVLAEGAYLEYLPDIVIPHKHSRFISRTQITIAPSATLLYAEVLMPGRKHMGGEVFQYDVFSSEVSARRADGRELFGEKFVIRPDQGDVRRVGVMQNYDVLGNVLLLAERALADRVMERLPAGVEAKQAWMAGASRLPHDAGLIYRVLGLESHAVLARVHEFTRLVRWTRFGVDQPYRRPF